MLSLALSLVVMTSSGGLLSDYTSEHVRLIDSPVTEVGASLLGARPPAYAQPPTTTMSLDQLKAEYTRLEEERPSLVGPIVMLSIGVALLITSSVLWDIAFYSYYVSWALFLVGVATFVGGVVLAIIGGIQLGRAIGGRHRTDRELRQLDGQIRAMEGSAPLPSGPMPPPPPPPQSQGFNGPQPTMALVGF